jgi:imidazole glycerol phosphate synthase glutamine amidotransferase subunit
MNPAVEVIVVRTGSANLASVLAAFERLDVAARVSDDAATVAVAPLAVLPGVGAFGPAMERLTARGLDDAITKRVAQGLPLLAICLGMQLLCESSDESPGIAGLGLVPGQVRRFRGPQRVPQMGWNTVTPAENAQLLRPGAAYFANSYRLAAIPTEDGWSGTTSDYGEPFASAIERGPLLACQFHPELSGAYGLALIRRWLLAATTVGGAAC